MAEIINNAALIIGYCVISVGGLLAASLLIYLPINYAWKNFVDVMAFFSVLKEAKRQGRSVLKSSDRE